MTPLLFIALGASKQSASRLSSARTSRTVRLAEAQLRTKRWRKVGRLMVLSEQTYVAGKKTWSDDEISMPGDTSTTDEQISVSHPWGFRAVRRVQRNSMDSHYSCFRQQSLSGTWEFMVMNSNYGQITRKTFVLLLICKRIHRSVQGWRSGLY